MKLEIYDPAMCCSTGVCGPSVDPELVRIQEALRQIQKQAPEVQISRYGLSADPQAFVDNAVVAELLKNEGPECLPLVFADGELISKGAVSGQRTTAGNFERGWNRGFADREEENIRLLRSRLLLTRRRRVTQFRKEDE